MAFPPTTWQDIDGYPFEETLEGFKSYERGDPVPGENHSDGFRWGWQNAYYDANSRDDDGFAVLRAEYIRNVRASR